MENDLQTLVYDNYSTFIGASDALTDLNADLSSLDNDLLALEQTTRQCEDKFTKIYNQLGPKWHEIKKLSNLESDLNKLKQL